MGDPPQRQGLNTIALIWVLVIPILTAVCALFVSPITKRIQVFQPKFPNSVTVATYTPNEFVTLLCLAGPIGIAVVSGIFGLVILFCWRWSSRLPLASLAFVFNLLFLGIALAAFVLELLRAFPFQIVGGAALPSGN